MLNVEDSIGVDASLRPRRAHARPRRTGGLRDPLLQIGLIVIAVVVGNALYLLGIFDPNPMAQVSDMAVFGSHGLFAGVNAIDPNSGFTAQALGHRSILDWFSGHVPWWNPFEGIGSPLAGEMQAASFFPPTIFLALANGQLFSHIVLELTAGITTYLLLRRLITSGWVAAMGGAAFALNGTFATIEHAPVNTIAFLPMLLLGIELSREASVKHRRGGWALIAIALALSIYAGFPEMSFIDGILALIWFLARARRLGRNAGLSYLRKFAAGGCTGLLLSAPILAAFVGYLPYADIGGHSKGFANASFPAAAVPRLIFPYVFGPLHGFNSFDRSGTLSTLWVEGSLSMSIVVLAAVGLFGRNHRVLRICLVVWILVSMGKTYGFTPATDVMNLIPGIRITAFADYATASWEFAAIVLAALGLDDLVSGRVGKRWVAVALVGILAFALAGARSALALVRQLTGAPHASTWANTSIVAGLAVVVLIGAIALFVPPRLRLVPVVVIVLLESLAVFVVPELSAPRHVTLDTRPVEYLQKHAGLYRFYSLGPVQPNYGSYFSIPSITTNDLPIPKLWKSYVAGRLDTNVNPLIFNGTSRLTTAGPTPAEELIRNLAAYEAISVKYVVIPNGLLLPASFPSASWPVVFHDRWTSIVQLPDPVPPFHAQGSSCAVGDESADAATISCNRSTTLVREELFMPGWSATVNGRATVVLKSGGLVQSIRVPGGQSRVVFHYQPPDTDLALWAFLVGLVLLVGGPRLASRIGRAQHRR
jgi:hypothetical protein